jgi:hypothetical protein
VSSAYKIGTTAGNIAAIDTLFSSPRDCEPHGDPIDYAESVELGDGTRRGMGWLRQNWHWDFLSESMRNSLFALMGPVYICTRMNSGSFGYFTAELVWPQTEPEHYANRVLDLTIELRKLVSYTP